MARTPVNPHLLSKDWELVKMESTNSKTWKKGELAELSSGLVQPRASAAATGAMGVFAQTQSSSTSGNEEVWVKRFSDGLELLVYVYDNNQVSAIANGNIGARYGDQTVANVSYLDLNQGTGQFEVMELASDDMPERSSYDGDFDGSTGTAAGLCRVKYRLNVS